MYNEYNLKISYTKVADKTFVPLCQGVIQSLTDNPNFPSVDSLLPQLVTAFGEYNFAIPTKAERNQINVAFKNEKRDIVKSIMRKIGFFVQMEANDDLVKLKSSGFPFCKKIGSSSSDLPMPIILGMETNGTPSQMIVKCKVVRVAKLYDVRVSTDEVNWMTTTDTKSKVVVNNLPSEVILYVQARMRNTKHTTPWSSSVQTRIFDSAVALSTSS